MTTQWLWVTAAASVLVTSAVAHAEDGKDAKVEVVADIVLASNQGDVIQPPTLAKMKDDFAKKGLKFTSFKLLETQKVVLTSTAPSELKLPNGTSARLRLSKLEEGKATVAVELRKVESKIVLGREGSVFVHGGKHGQGELVVVLQPASSARPRLAPPRPRELARPRVPPVPPVLQ